MFDNFPKISFTFLISVGDRSIFMSPPVLFFLFKLLLIPCDTKVLLAAIPKLGTIFLVKSFAYDKITSKILAKEPPCYK